MQFYTSFHQHKGKVLLTGYEDGRKIQKAIKLQPFIFLPSKEPTAYRTLQGSYAYRRDFDSTSDFYQWSKQNEGVVNFKYYGMTRHVYPFINEYYPGKMDYDPTKIVVANIDIETDMSLDVENTPKEVTSITILANGTYHAFGIKEYVPHLDNVVYYHCKDEADMFHRFLDVWQSIAPDVVTGWNIEAFDIPYLFNRMSMVIGAEQAVKLSPWKIVEPRMVLTKFGKERLTFIIYGVNTLDYQLLYMKFSFKMQENFKLNTIAHIVLGEKKIDYSQYESLRNLYHNNFQLFMEYNIHDVTLVDRIEQKEGILQQVYALAYDGKVTFSDTLATVQMWDVIIHNYLMEQNIVIPQPPHQTEDETKLPGGYVKEPVPGKYRWVMSDDLTSLYPKLIQQYNISPECLTGKMPTPDVETKEEYIDAILGGYFDDPDLRQDLLDNNSCVAASMYTFTKEYQGFIPALMESMFNDRALYKKSMIEAKKKYEETKDLQWLTEVSRANNMQMAKKIQLNSCYGALGNPNFRWFDLRLAESVTLSGQLAIRWIAGKLNALINKQMKTTDVDYIIAVDTDSVYMNLETIVAKTGLKETGEIVDYLDSLSKRVIEPYISQCYQELAEVTNAFSQEMDMKREVIADVGIWTAKKRYVLNIWDSEGVRFKEPELKIMGLEPVRAGAIPEVIRKALKQSFTIALRGTEDELHEFIASFREVYYNLPFEDIAYPRGINDIEKYVGTTRTLESNSIRGYKKGCPIHVRAAILYNYCLDDYGLDKNLYPPIEDGDKIRFCYLKMPNPLFENVIACPETLPRPLGLEPYIDHKLQFEKAFLEPLKTIVHLVGWTLEARYRF